MNELAQKLQPVEQQMSDEKERFLLFALFLREEAPNLWDLLVSAPWIDAIKRVLQSSSRPILHWVQFSQRSISNMEWPRFKVATSLASRSSMLTSSRPGEKAPND